MDYEFGIFERKMQEDFEGILEREIEFNTDYGKTSGMVLDVYIHLLCKMEKTMENMTDLMSSQDLHGLVIS